MRLHDGDTAGSLLVYPAEIILLRARAGWTAPDRPEGTPMLVITPRDLTGDESGDEFGAACAVITFHDRPGWRAAHRAARERVSGAAPASDGSAEVRS